MYLAGEQTEADLRTQIESALKRTSRGFLKVVGIWTPPQTDMNDPMLGDVLQPLESFQTIQQQLSQEYTVRGIDLSTGQVSADVDVLVLIEPTGFTDRELFTVDQYLMRGGAVIVVGGAYRLTYDQYQNTLSLTPIADGIGPLLQHYGVMLGNSLVLDEQNAAFPVTTVRSVGGMQVQEIQAVNYPFFVDVRSDGMNTENPIVANLPTVTMSWASPVQLDEAKNAGRETAVLLQTSNKAWERTDTTIEPDFNLYPELGFSVPITQQTYPLAVTVQGIFASYFANQPNPFQSDPTLAAAGSPTGQYNTIATSPDSARLIVIGSSTLVDDFTTSLSARLNGDLYLNNLQFLQNAVDWSVEDLDLLSIRARGSASRVLNALEENEQTFWEVANYVVALVALVAIYLAWRARSRSEQPIELLPQTQVEVGD